MRQLILEFLHQYLHYVHIPLVLVIGFLHQIADKTRNYTLN